MRRIPDLGSPLVLCGALLALASCAAPQPGPGEGRVTAAPSDTGPMNSKERYEAERWARASAGLRFDASSGLVEVEPLAAGADATRPPPPAAARRAEAERHLALGDELFASNREIDALAQYGLAARTDASLAQAYLGIGAVMRRKGDTDAALASFRTALDREPSNAEAHYRLALELWTASERDAAVAEMESVLVLDADHGGAHERLAVWKYYAGDEPAARWHVEQAERLGRQVPAQLAALLERR